MAHPIQLPTFTHLRLACENPVLDRELRERMRGARSYWITGGYTAAVCAWVLFLYTGLAHLFRELPPQQAAPLLGEGIWTWGCVLQAFLLPLAMPALTAGAITREREREMLELLLLTHQSPVRICLGKLFSGVGLGLTLLAASVPPLCLSLFLGGITPDEIVHSLCVLAATVVLGGALGLAASSMARNTTSAATSSYLVLGFVIVGMPLALGYIARAPGYGVVSDLEIAAVIGACYTATFAPAVGLSALLLALARRRTAPAPAHSRRRRLLVGGLTWCALSTIVSHPGMTELMQSGRSLLLFHPGVAVVARMSEKAYRPATASGIYGFPYASSTGPYLYYAQFYKEEARPDDPLGTLIARTEGPLQSSSPQADFPGARQLNIGLNVVGDVLWASSWIVPHLWWMCLLLYLSVAAWCFLIAVVRLRRMRSG